MSLPLGFSPFDDYDSPYATTNAAIRRQSRHVQGQATPGHVTPTSSFQQQQQQRRPSQGSFGGVGGTDAPPRRPSPPPPIPAAEDFGSSGRYNASRAPSTDSQGVRHIAKPMPLGAPWVDGASPTSPHRNAVMPSSSSTPTHPQMPTRSPPASPRSSPSSSPLASPRVGATDSPASSRRAPPPPPSTSSRFNAFRRKGAEAPASTTPQYPPTPSKRNNLPPPVPISASLPEPADPPAASEVALATPADDDVGALRQQSHVAHPEMRQVATPVSDDDEEPALSDEEADSPSRTFRTPTEEAPARAFGTKPSRDAQSSYGRNGAAGTAAGLAGLGTAAAMSSNASPQRARDVHNTAPHTTYNMGTSEPFNEKVRSDDRPLLTGGAGAGTGETAAARSYKPFNEGSRGWSDSPGIAGASGGASGGSALARSWRAHKKRWIIGIVLLLVVILAAAIGGGVAGSGSSNSSSGSSSGSGNGSGTSGNGGGGGGSSRGIGPLDSRLSKSFYGVNYAPLESDPDFGCGCNITGVIHDITILSQLTSRVRLLGSACNETALVLDAVRRLGVDMEVWPAVVLTSSSTLTSTSFTTQLDNISFAFDGYGTSNIGGVYVGDEYVTSMGSTSSLLRFITTFRDLVSTNSDWGSVLVGTTETASTWSTTLAQEVDFMFANDESWDEGLTGAAGAAYSAETFQDFVVSVAEDSTNTPTPYISAIGWPTASQTGISTSVTSVANLQSLLDAYVCEANTNGTRYFWFELYDDSQEAIDESGGGTPNTALAGYWGLFDSSRTLKDITLPRCVL